MNAKMMNLRQLCFNSKFDTLNMILYQGSVYMTLRDGAPALSFYILL